MMKKIFIYWFMSVVVLGLASCQLNAPQNPNPNPTPNPGNPDTGNPNPTTPNPNTPNPTTPVTVPTSAGMVVPLRRSQIEQNFSSLGVDGAYFAAREIGSGTLITTGTITQSSNQFSYAAQPSDRLRFVFSNGSVLEYTFTVLEGDLTQPDGTRFLRKDHHVVYKLITSGTAPSAGTNLEVSLERSNGVYQNSLKGILVDAGVSYDVDTQTQGRVLSELGNGSVRFESEEQTTGTITSTGFSATIDETFSYTLVSVSRAAEDVRHTINNTWTLGDDNFALANATIFRVFSDGRPTEFDSWVASGVVTRNGQNVGGLSQEQGAGSVDTVVTVDGQKTVLFSDQTF
jgi:hypothetical protein